MRIAVLILAIMGFMVSLGVGACTTVCAGCEGSMGTVCGGGSPGGVPGVGLGSPNQEDLTEAYRKLFWGTVIMGVGVFVQAILILTGGIVVFSKLGKGESGKIGGDIMAVGLGLSLVTAVVAIFVVSQVDQTVHFKSDDIFASFFMKAFVGNILPIIATVLAFFAKPDPMPVKEVVYVTTQPPGSV